MKYVDASAVLRVVFMEPGPSVPIGRKDWLISSAIVEVEALRAVDRLRLRGEIDDAQTATKRKELADFLALLDLVPVDRPVLDRAKAPFSIQLRALDAVHVATAEVLSADAPGERLEFWTHDLRQAHAALSRGLTVNGA